MIRFCKFRAMRSCEDQKKGEKKLKLHLPSGRRGCFRTTSTSEPKFHRRVPNNTKNVAAAQRSFDGSKLQQGWEGTSEHTLPNFVFRILVASSPGVLFPQVRYLQSKEQYFLLVFKIPPS